MPTLISSDDVEGEGLAVRVGKLRSLPAGCKCTWTRPASWGSRSSSESSEGSAPSGSATLFSPPSTMRCTARLPLGGPLQVTTPPFHMPYIRHICTTSSACHLCSLCHVHHVTRVDMPYVQQAVRVSCRASVTCSVQLLSRAMGRASVEGQLYSLSHADCTVLVACRLYSLSHMLFLRPLEVRVPGRDMLGRSIPHSIPPFSSNLHPLGRGDHIAQGFFLLRLLVNSRKGVSVS